MLRKEVITMTKTIIFRFRFEHAQKDSEVFVATLLFSSVLEAAGSASKSVSADRHDTSSYHLV